MRNLLRLMYVESHNCKSGVSKLNDKLLQKFHAPHLAYDRALPLVTGEMTAGGSMGANIWVPITLVCVSPIVS